MITSSILAVVAIHRLKGRPIWQAVLSPFLAVEAAFLAANLTKVAARRLRAAADRRGPDPVHVDLDARRRARVRPGAEQSDLPLADAARCWPARPPLRARGTAVFLTADAAARSPLALMHNLKHNQVLHEQVVLLTVQDRRAGRACPTRSACRSRIAPPASRP